MATTDMFQANLVPNFSSVRGENVNAYFRSCRLMWMHLHPGDEYPTAALKNFNEACAIQAYNGLKDEALEYANQLEDFHLSNWDMLQMELKGRFPYEPEESEPVSTRVFGLKQHGNTLDAYFEKARDILFCY
ncbi:hypothetical protein N7478_008236 [Penicillium angulare]|uniref:uncharacterized protein n=1 Tax=Penicillium angulare TaxID=116970 RepID=UPI002541E1FE|nr:uncharacterized protein N7478_008236 [Penicillium angulare]KAJ5273111.1 hypothetical protein N7478_008236 [Penicillium angulare]